MMVTLTRVRWTTLCAAGALALAAAPAAANLEVSEPRLRATTSALTFRGSAELSVACAVTLSMALRSEIPLTERSVAGEVTEARVGERCTGGAATLLGLPWTVRLVTFREGVVTLQIEGIGVLLSNTGGTLRCLYRGGPEVKNAADPITTLRLLESPTLSLSSTLSGSGTCPRQASATGQFSTPEEEYTETVLAGLPLQPSEPILEFGEMMQTKERVFINDWIVAVAISGHRIRIAGRFASVFGASECATLAVLQPGELCIDKIQLNRARTVGEPVNADYLITSLGLPVGWLTLER